ncbi:hypothetical protein, partial [Escherichia coli]|uniref:hypothetical protein n=1 Tax=Escherichia coli TaxID=562 RepID=UPI0028BEC9DE
SAQIREILINESAWEEMTCLFAPSLRVQGVLDGGLYFMTNAISRKKCGGWFRMRAGVLVRGTPLQCIYPSVLIQKYLEKMPAMPSGQIAYMWN